MTAPKYHSPNPNLTRREIETLQLILEEEDYNRVAERMIVSVTTVKTHTNNIFTKLGVHSKMQAVLKGLKKGLVKLPMDDDDIAAVDRMLLENVG